jgi:putative PIN family toxin of toxin-antitoxin system
VVVDTGVLISAFAFGGVPAKAVKKAFSEADLYISPSLLDEYRNVPLAMKKAGKIDDNQFRALIAGISASVSKIKIIYPDLKIDICRDKSDNMVIECCVAAKADFLITGDKDLLSIKDLPYNFKILSPREYIRILQFSV